VQTVSKTEAGNFPKLLQAIQQQKGTGITINTSFNRNREPMVYNPIDAVSAFYGSGLDAVFVGSFLIKK
jgi:carbamoyltransferase